MADENEREAAETQEAIEAVEARGPVEAIGGSGDHEELQGQIMMHGVLPSFLNTARAFAAEHPQAEQLKLALLGALEHNAHTSNEGEDDLWTAAASLCRAVFDEQQSALELIQRSQELDKHNEYAWKTLCALCYLGASVQKKTLPLLAINLHMAVAEFVYAGTHQIPELYEEVVVAFFTEHWTRTFENARFRFQTPWFVETDLREALQSELNVRVQRLLRVMAFGLSTSLPERGREWFTAAVAV